MQKLLQKSATLRNWKEQMVGIDRIKDDPFESDRMELEQYESVLRLVKTTVENFHHSLGDMSRCHGEMMGALKRFHELNENISQRKRIDAIDLAVESLADEYDKTVDQMDVMTRKLDALLAMHAGLGERLKDRDKAHAAKTHYDSKIQELNAKETDREKIERNLKKQKEALEEYTQKEQLTVRECRDALNTKYKDTDQVLGLYVKVLCDFFVNVGDKFEKIEPLTEDMIKSSVIRGGGDPILPPPTVSTSVIHEQANEEHNELRNALGLRLKPKPQPDSDNESDLFTPPPRRN